MEVSTSVTIDMLAWDVDSRDRFMLSEKEGHSRFMNLQLNNKSAHFLLMIKYVTLEMCSL